jgi:hypothetical protein
VVGKGLMMVSPMEKISVRVAELTCEDCATRSPMWASSAEPLADLQVTVADRAYTPILPPSVASDLPSSFNFHHSALNIAASDCLSTSGLRENFPTDPPISLYGASKKCSELLSTGLAPDSAE